MGASSDAGRWAACLSMASLLRGIPSSSASSELVGSRPRASESMLAILRILEILSTMWTGSLIVLLWLARARLIDCLIHQDPYVLSLPPFSGSNLSTAFMRPMLPSEMRSESGSP